ncbi:MAG: bactofilin family protein [Wolinella sp.]
MAIFANGDKSIDGASAGTTIVASGTKIKGEIVIDCNLHIDGEFEGTIRSKNGVTIGKDGSVGGEIYAERLIVSGNFKGLCDCDVIEILPQGRIDGEIITKELVIERKGRFVGESKIKEENQRDLLDKVRKVERPTEKDKAEKVENSLDPK